MWWAAFKFTSCSALSALCDVLSCFRQILAINPAARTCFQLLLVAFARFAFVAAALHAVYALFFTGSKHKSCVIFLMAAYAIQFSTEPQWNPNYANLLVNRVVRHCFIRTVVPVARWWFSTVTVFDDLGKLAPSNDQFVFAVHPHGILPIATLCSLLEKSPANSFGGQFSRECRFLVASFCFWIPLYRDLILALGAVDASWKCASLHLKAGYSVVVVPGGVREAMLASEAEDVFVLEHRSGFIRLAKEHSVSVISILGMNENCAFYCLHLSFLKRVPIPLFLRRIPIAVIISRLLPDGCDPLASAHVYREKFLQLHRQYARRFSFPSVRLVKLI